MYPAPAIPPIATKYINRYTYWSGFLSLKPDNVLEPIRRMRIRTQIPITMRAIVTFPSSGPVLKLHRLNGIGPLLLIINKYYV